jgi:hypothetical protein
VDDFIPYPLDGTGIPDDDSALQGHAQSVGAAFSPFSHVQDWERGFVQQVYPDRYTCDVYTERGRFLSGVAWPQAGGAVRAPKRGTRYAVHFGLGVPTLHEAHTEVQPFPDEADVPALQVSPVAGVGGEDVMYADQGSGNARGSHPKDVLPGDMLEVGDLGQMMGVLSGGVVVLKANELAQIIATQARNLLRLVGQNFQLYTGAGSLEFLTDEGKTSMVLRAGADSETESSPDAENYRIRCELGDAGELVDFRVTDGKGRALYRHFVDPDGRVETESARKTELIAEDRRTEIGGADRTSVGADREIAVTGSSVETVGGTKGIDAQGSLRMQAGGDAALTAIHDVFIAAARNASFSATGDLVSPDPAMLFTVANGDVFFNIGSPLAGDAQVRQSGYRVDTVTGAIKLHSLLGKVEINALPGQVKIGGAPGVGPYSAVLYEMLEVFLDVFGTLIDSHTHTCPAAAAPTTPPLIPPYLSSSYGLMPAKSNTTKLGG